MLKSNHSLNPCSGLILLPLLATAGRAQEPGTGSAPLANPAAAASGTLEGLLAQRPLINKPLTVDEAVAIALRESPVVRGAEDEVDAELGRLNAARAERRSMLSANSFVSGGTIPNIVESPSALGAIMGLPRGGYFDQNLMLTTPLYTGGRLKTLVKQANALHQASQADLEGQRQEVALLTRTAYREVQARRALVDVQQARLKENEEQLRLDHVREGEGKIPAFFVLRDEAEVAATQQELTNAQRDVDLALLQLKTVMGVHPASEINIVGALEYQAGAALIAQLTGPRVATLAAGATSPPTAPTGLPADVSALLRIAERERPELRGAAFRIAGAEAGAAAIGQSYRPQVNAFVMGDISKARGQNSSGGTTFGLAASIPIFTGGREHAANETARADSRRQQHERDRIMLEIAQGVNSAYLNLRAAEQNIGTAQAALRSAQEDYRVMLVRYDAGKSVLVELLDAQATRVRAESNVVQALYGYNVARDQLLRSVGVLAPQ